MTAGSPGYSERGDQIHPRRPQRRRQTTSLTAQRSLTRPTDLWSVQDVAVASRFPNRANVPTAPAANNRAPAGWPPVSEHARDKSRSSNAAHPPTTTRLSAQADDEFSHSPRHGARHLHPSAEYPHRWSRSRRCRRGGAKAGLGLGLGVCGNGRPRCWRGWGGCRRARVGLGQLP